MRKILFVASLTLAGCAHLNSSDKSAQVTFYRKQPVLGQAIPEPELPDYEVSGSPDEGLFFVAKNFPLTQAPAVDAMMLAEAKRRCAPKIAFPADYLRLQDNITVDGQTMVGMVRYERIALCVDPMTPIKAAPNDFHPSPNDEYDLISTFKAYFAALETGNVDALMRMRDYPLFPRKVLLKQIDNYKLQHAQPKRNILKTSWYSNPPKLHNGIFGEVLYIQVISKTEALCGAAMFYKRAEHDYVFSRLLTLPIEDRPTGTSEDRESSPCDAKPASAS